MYHYRAINVDLVYESYFETPLFDLPKNQTEVIKNLYSSLGQRWYLPLNNLQVSGGMSMADVKVTVILFNGNGIIELSPEKFRAKFSGVVRDKDSNDLVIIKDVIHLGKESIQSVFNNVEIKNENFTFNAELMVDEEFDAISHLSQFNNLSIEFSGEDVGASEVRSSVRMEFVNQDASWKTSLLLSPSHNEYSSLYCNLFSMFEYPATIKMSVDSKISHMDNVIDAVLKKINIVEHL